MTYDELLAACEGIVKIKEVDFSKEDFLKNFKGLYKNSNIAINRNIDSDKEKTCILAEELGHHHTSFGNILNTKDVKNIKQEKIARNWGFEKLVGVMDIVDAYKKCVRSKYELSEYLNVTEDFLEASIQHYREKYGLYCEIDHYIVYFDPLGVLEMF